MKVKVATSQFKAIKGDFDANLNKAISLVEKASNENVDILLLQELFQDHYFCKLFPSYAVIVCNYIKNF